MNVIHSVGIRNLQRKIHNNDLIFVASPYSGYKVNSEITPKEKLILAEMYAERICRDVMFCRGVPFAPHLYFPRFLDEQVLEERQRGMNYGAILIARCDKILFATDHGISSGMQEELEIANDNQKLVLFYSIG